VHQSGKRQKKENAEEDCLRKTLNEQISSRWSHLVVEESECQRKRSPKTSGEKDTRDVTNPAHILLLTIKVTYPSRERTPQQRKTNSEIKTQTLDGLGFGAPPCSEIILLSLMDAPQPGQIRRNEGGRKQGGRGYARSL
jgi:hypothetical protein